MKKPLRSGLLLVFFSMFFSHLPAQNINKELPAFSLTLIGEEIGIDWSILENDKVSRYEVERAGEDLNFYPIAKLDSKTSTTGDSNYEFRDIDPLNGFSAYRIKSILKNGTIKTFEALDIEMIKSKSSPKILSLIANNHQLDLRISSPDLEPFTLEISTLEGQVILEQAEKPAHATLSASFETSSLGTGMYYVYLKNEKGIIAQRKFRK